MLAEDLCVCVRVHLGSRAFAPNELARETMPSVPRELTAERTVENTTTLTPTVCATPSGGACRLLHCCPQIIVRAVPATQSLHKLSIATQRD